MGTISLEHSDRLYWLGRYTERFFTTIKALGKQFDKMLGTEHGYTDYLGCFGLVDTYSLVLSQSIRLYKQQDQEDNF